LQRARALHEQELGAQHPEVAGSLNNLAALSHGQGRDEREKSASAVLETYHTDSPVSSACVWDACWQRRPAISERQWGKPFHFGHYAYAEDPALFLDIFVLAWMVPQQNVSDIGRNLAGVGQSCFLAISALVYPDWGILGKRLQLRASDMRQCAGIAPSSGRL
jgi:hypothetical protein